MGCSFYFQTTETYWVNTVFKIVSTQSLDSNLNAILLAILSNVNYLFQNRYFLQVQQILKETSLKTFKEWLLRISRSSSFPSVIVEGKKELLKKLLLALRFECFEQNKTSPCLELNYTNKKVIYSYIFCRISIVS